MKLKFVKSITEANDTSKTLEYLKGPFTKTVVDALSKDPRKYQLKLMGDKGFYILPTNKILAKATITQNIDKNQEQNFTVQVFDTLNKQLGQDITVDILSDATKNTAQFTEIVKTMSDNVLSADKIKITESVVNEAGPITNNIFSQLIDKFKDHKEKKDIKKSLDMLADTLISGLSAQLKLTDGKNELGTTIVKEFSNNTITISIQAKFILGAAFKIGAESGKILIQSFYTPLEKIEHDDNMKLASFMKALGTALGIDFKFEDESASTATQSQDNQNNTNASSSTTTKDPYETKLATTLGDEILNILNGASESLDESIQKVAVDNYNKALKAVKTLEQKQSLLELYLYKTVGLKDVTSQDLGYLVDSLDKYKTFDGGLNRVLGYMLMYCDKNQNKIPALFTEFLATSELTDRSFKNAFKDTENFVYDSKFYEHAGSVDELKTYVQDYWSLSKAVTEKTFQKLNDKICEILNLDKSKKPGSIEELINLIMFDGPKENLNFRSIDTIKDIKNSLNINDYGYYSFGGNDSETTSKKENPDIQKMIDSITAGKTDITMKQIPSILFSKTFIKKLNGSRLSGKAKTELFTALKDILSSGK